MTIIENLFVKQSKTIIFYDIDSEKLTVSDLKYMIYDRFNIIGKDQDHLRLLFNGKILDDEKYLANYNIENYSTVHIFYAMYPNKIKFNNTE